MAARQEDLIHEREAVVYAFPPLRARRAARRAVRRRRLALAAVGIVVVGASLIATGPSGSAPAAASSAPKKVVLQPGDTLWEVAERFVPAGVDVRAYLDAILERNQISAAVPAGTRIRLP